MRRREGTSRTPSPGACVSTYESSPSGMRNIVPPRLLDVRAVGTLVDISQRSAPRADPSAGALWVSSEAMRSVSPSPLCAGTTCIEAVTCGAFEALATPTHDRGRPERTARRSSRLAQRAAQTPPLVRHRYGPAVIGLGSTPSHATNEQQARERIDAALTAAGWLAR